jgi:hypothetical protein
MSIPPWFGVKQTQEVFYMIRAIGGDGRKNGEKITHRFRQGGCRGAVSYIHPEAASIIRLKNL